MFCFYACAACLRVSTKKRNNSLLEPVERADDAALGVEAALQARALEQRGDLARRLQHGADDDDEAGRAERRADRRLARGVKELRGDGEAAERQAAPELALPQLGLQVRDGVGAGRDAFQADVDLWVFFVVGFFMLWVFLLWVFFFFEREEQSPNTPLHYLNKHSPRQSTRPPLAG